MCVPARRARASARAGAAPASLHPALDRLNSSTKWVVSLAAFVVVVSRRDALSCWCLLGSIANSFLSRALKYAINEQRPENARKADPGMPSSHAQSLYYFGTFTALAVLGWGGGVFGGATGAQMAAAAALQAVAAFLTWLRVAAGYHTVPQVAVGGLAGAAAGAAWLALGEWALPAMASDANRGALQALYGLTVAASVLFVAKFAKRWRKEVAKLAPEAAA